MVRFVIFVVFLTIVPWCAHAVWPLYWEFNNEKRFFGPLISYERTDDATRFVFRPLLSSYDSHEGGVYTFLYPLGKRTEEESYFIPLYRSKKMGEDSDTAIFPFFWGKSAKGKYGGVFPFYGRLYERFGKDEMGFFLWPLYSYTKAEGATKTNFMWPFFSLYEGEERGLKAWPLYGTRTREGVKSSTFFLWPLFTVEKKNLDTDQPTDVFYAFPFYLQSTSRTKAFYSVLWPLFHYTKDEDKTQWRFLASLWSRTEGKENRGYSLLPLISRDTRGKDETFNFLWPLYHESEWYSRDDRFFLRRVAVINRYIEEPDKLFFNVWPFFEYEKHKEDHVFLFPSLLPFRIEGFDRIIKPLFTLYEQRQTGNKEMVSVLYGLYTWEREVESSRTRIAFLLDLKKDEDGLGLEILSGLFGMDKNHLKLFFVPIKRGSAPAMKE